MRKNRLDLDDEDEAEVNLTPMLDVVFIMLIFFIVTASFVKEAGIDVNRPGAATAERKEKGNILVAISADNQIWIDRRQVDPRALRANIERMHAENPLGAVVIQADEGIHLRQFSAQLLRVTLHHAPGHHQTAAGAGLFQLSHFQDGVDGFLARGVDEAAGVHDDDVGAAGVGCDEHAVAA